MAKKNITRIQTSWREYTGMNTIKIIIILFTIATTTHGVDIFNFKNKEDKKRFLQLTNEIRCPSCQSQSIKDSNSMIASDLKLKISNMINEDFTDQEIFNFMKKHYGEHILYRPEINNRNLILWIFPIFLFLCGLIVLFFNLKPYQRYKSLGHHKKL